MLLLGFFFLDRGQHAVALATWCFGLVAKAQPFKGFNSLLILLRLVRFFFLTLFFGCYAEKSVLGRPRTPSVGHFSYLTGGYLCDLLIQRSEMHSLAGALRPVRQGALCEAILISGVSIDQPVPVRNDP